MPYCSQCGNQVASNNIFCTRCGARQPGAGAAAPNYSAVRPDPMANITGRTASILCYIPGIGWIASIVVLAAEKFRHDRRVRFDAFQGLYLFVVWLIEDWVLRPVLQSIPHVQIDGLVKAALVGASVFMIIKAAHEEQFSLPIIGELAERSVNE